MPQTSITKYEQEVLPQFRSRLSSAESTEDVKKCFAFTAKELVGKAMDSTFGLRGGDVVLAPRGEPYFVLSHRLKRASRFAELWKQSDIRRILGDMARAAMHRYWHLEKHRERTESKLRPSKALGRH